jgi:hypothetical protein
LAAATELWEEARRQAEQLLRIDPENWPGNLLLCQLVSQTRANPGDPLARQAIEFAHKQRAYYEQAIEKIGHLPQEKINPDQQQRMLSRWECLPQITSLLPAPAPASPPPLGRNPWRTREQLTDWASYLNGETRALPGDEIRVVQEIQRVVVRRLHWASPEEAKDHFREFVQDLTLDTSRWPDERLPSSEQAFKYCALDYVLAGVCHLPDDDESKSPTKAQNLRKRWSTRAQLRKRLEREPTLDELAQECQRRYGWGRPMFDHLLELESFCRLRPLDESRWEDVGRVRRGIVPTWKFLEAVS